MSETDVGPLPISKRELMAPQYKPSLLYWTGDSRIYQLLPILLLSCKISSISNNSPQILISLCFKSGKICIRNSIYSFLYLFVLLYLRWSSVSYFSLIAIAFAFVNHFVLIFNKRKLIHKYFPIIFKIFSEQLYWRTQVLLAASEKKWTCVI